MPGLCGRLHTYCPKKWPKWRSKQHTSADQTLIICVPVASPGFQKKDGMHVKSGRSGTLKPGTLGLEFKATKCSHAGAGDLGVLTTYKTSFMKMVKGC